MKYIIVGLGNPGGAYATTRHNTGRFVLEEFRKVQDISDWEMKKPYNALATKGEVKGAEVLLLEPETMMNNSGKSLVSLVKSKKQAEQLVVIYDDLDLPLGKWKFSFNRGSGGHKGVESIMRALRTKKFTRVRMGVSPSTASGALRKPVGDKVVVNYILTKFKAHEIEQLKTIFKKVARALEVIATEGPERAMNEMN